MKRIVVVGPPGSGKTTTARAIGERLGVPHTELDALWWGPNWTPAGAERFKDELAAILAEPTWVLDGNYFDVGGTDVIYPAADTVVWLDLGRWTTIPRGLRRSYTRVLMRTELWHGNREPLISILHPIRMTGTIYKKQPEYNQRIGQLQSHPSTAHLDWIRLRSPRAITRWIGELA